MIRIKELALESLVDPVDQYFDDLDAETISLEERGVMRRIGGAIADHGKMLFAWLDRNGAKIRKTREELRQVRRMVETKDSINDVRGNGLLTYLGNRAHHAQTSKLLVELVEQDIRHIEKHLLPMLDTTGIFARELVEWIYAKDNDWKWGYDEAIQGCLPIINKHISKLTSSCHDRKVDGYDQNDLRVEDGSLFSPLLLGNYVISSSWQYAHDQAKHIQTTTECVETYVSEGQHDFVKVPKLGNKYSVTGTIDKKQLLALLDAADFYLDAADQAARSIKSNALPIWKLLVRSNLFSGYYGLAIKASVSANYRVLYQAMHCSKAWSMKLQRKSATRNQDLAKELIAFVRVNAG